MNLSRSRLREPFCGLSHLVGALLSVVGLIALLILARGRLWYVIGYSIYGSSLILLYTASALYHSLHVGPKWADRLQRWDHIAIYLLIAGTYAPLCLVPLHGALGWRLLTAVYAIALVGIAEQVFWKNAPGWVCVVLYIAMGWMAVLALPGLHAALPGQAVNWLIAGGVVYSAGTVVYATNRPTLWPGKFSAHDLWHLFVLGGSACHFVLMLYTL